MDIEIEEGLLITPSLHDAILMGLVLHDEGDLHLIVKPVERSSISLAMRCVYRLVADDFREGNIILDVEMIAGDEVDRSDLDIFYGPSDKAGGAGFHGVAFENGRRQQDSG